MSKIFIMSGLPFSGKSTLSKRMSERLDIPRISFDETWIQIEQEQNVVPGSSDIEKWKYVNKVCEEKARKYLKDGVSVIYDNLGSEYKHREKIRNLADEVGADSIVIYINIGKEEVNKRREANLVLQERAQVSDINFLKALETFELPKKSEDVLIFSPSQEIDLWIDRELKPNNGLSLEQKG